MLILLSKDTAWTLLFGWWCVCGATPSLEVSSTDSNVPCRHFHYCRRYYPPHRQHRKGLVAVALCFVGFDVFVMMIYLLTYLPLVFLLYPVVCLHPGMLGPLAEEGWKSQIQSPQRYKDIPKKGHSPPATACAHNPPHHYHHKSRSFLTHRTCNSGQDENICLCWALCPHNTTH